MSHAPVSTWSTTRPWIARTASHIARPEADGGAHLPEPDSSPLPPVTTVLTPDERARVDAAGVGLYRTLHRESVDDAIRDVREQRATALLVSVARCDEHGAARMATVVREFPRVPAVALLTEMRPGAGTAVLSLGRSGVRTLVDVRQPTGWRELRNALVNDQSRDLERLALSRLAHDLIDAPGDCWRFFEMLFRCSPRLSTIRELSQNLGVLPSTLMSRFYRARLPAPKRYLALARLTRAARLFENAGLSVANVADTLEYSSPQSFGRHVRTLLRMTAVEFREHYDGEGMLMRFREDLVIPHRDALRTFAPLMNPPGWVPKTKTATSGLRDDRQSWKN